MRLAFIAQPFDRMDPPVQGGSLSLWIYQVARRCAARGHQTVVLANHGGQMTTRRVRHEDVDFIFTPTGLNDVLNRAGEFVSRLARSIGWQAALPTFAAPWRDAAYARAVGRQLRDLDCDAVLVMNYSQLVPTIRRMSPRTKIYLYMQCEWLTQLQREAISRRLNDADLVGGCSEYITDLIERRFPEHGAKCVTLTNAALPVAEDAQSTQQDGELLFVGRVSPEKGVHVLIEAFHEVVRRFPQASLRVVGGVGSAPLEFLVGVSVDPHVAALRRFYEPVISGNGKDPYLTHLELAAGPELGHRIFLEGRVPHDQIATAYRTAAILVNPSLSESFGMSLVEGMMHGMPVVATRVGGMPYIVAPDETGFLVEPDNAGDLARAICAILEDRANARQMGAAGRARALSQFTWDRTADTLINQVGRVIGA